MTKGVSNSQFYMWRTLFSIAHADNVVTDEEIEFMAHILEDIDFSDEQTKILKDDIITPKDVEGMFQGITESEDRMQFFNFARDLVWVDGDFGSEEQGVMLKLFEAHMEDTNIDDLVGIVPLELEEESKPVTDHSRPKEKMSVRSMMSSFRRRFLSLIGAD
ncbi:MAG: DUF533 domain-containing protein [Alphaproteobacteria bacterium]